MKFLIFKWWEKWLKPIIYIVILVLTAALLSSYFCINDDSGIVAFVVSIVYALFLFLVTIPLNKIDRYTADKLFEREGYYLTLTRLREVTNSTISKVSLDDFDEFERNVFGFQLFTGRDEASCKARLEGQKTPICVREKGFVYTEKMKSLENAFLKAHKFKDEKELKKAGKKLKKHYNKSCKALEKNYARIMSTYGGVLQDLVERDNAASDTDFSLNDINSKVEDIAGAISDMRSDIDELAGTTSDTQREWFEFCKELMEKMDSIESMVYEIADSKNNQ